MELQNHQILIEGEIVIDAPIIVNKNDWTVENSSPRKCPHCCTGTADKDNFYQHTDEENCETEVQLSCNSCGKRWSVRYKNPFLPIKI